MNRDEVLNVLRAHKATLAQRFGVVDLAFIRVNRSRPSHGRQRRGHLSAVRFAGDVEAIFWPFSSILKTCWGVQLIW